MSKKNPCICALFALFLFASAVFSQTTNDLWQAADSFSKNKVASDFWVNPEKARAFHLNRLSLQKILQSVPMEILRNGANALPAVRPGTEIVLPMPDGGFARFKIVESPVMAPELAAKFPEIKTFLGTGVDDPDATVRLDWTPAGFHAQVLSPRGAVYIDPYFKNDASTYTSYYKSDYQKAADGFRCLVTTNNKLTRSTPHTVIADALAPSDGFLRTYRLAVAATGEYTQFHGGTVTAGMGAIVTAVNRVTGIYEVELAVRLMLVSNNNLLVYTNPNSDPYSNFDGLAMLDQNQTTIDQVIGSANYDIGHVFSTGGGGIAELGVVCNTSFKAEGVTGLPRPIGDSFYVDYVAHEIGHQFNANHTFNSVMDQCAGGNLNAATAFEPGSGSTIMSYAGICGSDNLQAHSDPYFHSISNEEIMNYILTGAGSSCPVLTTSGNSAPIISAGTNYTIPKATPFALTATASDPNGDTLKYCWEERDLGPSTTLLQPDNGSSPLFRSLSPSLSPTRIFPRLANILNGTTSLGERLPTTNRVMNFQVTVRDNRINGGGINSSDMQVTVNADAGPFTITSSFANVAANRTQIITWDVAGTSLAPVNTTNVNILLSTNGGLSFPIILVTNIPNDGSEMVLFPDISTTTARLKVEAANNIFFDISHSNFSITRFTDLALFMAGSPDPVTIGNILSYSLLVTNAGSLLATNVIVTNFLPANVDIISASSSVGACFYTNGTVLCQLGNMDLNQTANITISIVPTETGIVTNRAVVISNDSDATPADNTNMVTTTVVPLPFITNVASHLRNGSSVVITWNTMTNATSQVEYGSTPDLGDFSAFDASLLTKHAEWLAGLNLDTTYYFRVVSRVGTNEFKSALLTFSTDLSVVVDNPQASYSGLWTTDTVATNNYGGSYVYASTTSGSSTAQITYRPTLLQSGDYDLFLWYPSTPDNTTNAIVQVSYSGGTLLANIDQTINSGSWQLFSTNKTFAAGNSGYVRLANNTGESNKLVIADAVKWTFVPMSDATTNNTFPSWWATFYFGMEIDPSLDPDGDGYTSLAEYVLGTSPVDSLSRLNFRVETMVNGIRAIFSPVQAGRLYQLQFSSDLVTWTTSTSSVDVIDGEGIITQAGIGSDAVFYRLAVQFVP